MMLSKFRSEIKGVMLFAQPFSITSAIWSFSTAAENGFVTDSEHQVHQR
jgi:hypothetical protein